MKIYLPRTSGTRGIHSEVLIQRKLVALGMLLTSLIAGCGSEDAAGPALVLGDSENTTETMCAQESAVVEQLKEELTQKSEQVETLKRQVSILTQSENELKEQVSGLVQSIDGLEQDIRENRWRVRSLVLVVCLLLGLPTALAFGMILAPAKSDFTARPRNECPRCQSRIPEGAKECPNPDCRTRF